MKRKRMTKPRRSGLIRYPGGKGKLIGQITDRLRRMCAVVGIGAEYREPFFGAGVVGLAMINQNPGISQVWFNDADAAMAALWDTVIHNPTSLRVFVEVTPEAMRLFPKNDCYKDDIEVLRSISDPRDVLMHPPGLVAAMKLTVHQMSYSGLGTCAGGPMSNRLCRYNVDLLNAKIQSFNEILLSVKLRHGTCTCLDFDQMFDPGKAIFYCDPPYVKAGPQLYQIAFTQSDHERLAKRLRTEKRPWLLSYDDDALIHRLYGGWCSIEEVKVGYSLNGCNKKTELLISNSV
jgi:DNA adenine methylase